MTKEIIERLNLKPTDIEIGNSKRNGVIIYQYNDNTLMASCDKDGNLDNLTPPFIVRVFIKNPRITFRISPHILNEDLEQFHSHCDRAIKTFLNAIY